MRYSCEVKNLTKQPLYINRVVGSTDPKEKFMIPALGTGQIDFTEEESRGVQRELKGKIIIKRKT